jgi:hypothetical protein
MLTFFISLFAPEAATALKSDKVLQRMLQERAARVDAARRYWACPF